LKLQGLIRDAKRELGLLEVEEKVVQRQLDSMQNVGGASFLPKPILGPTPQSASDWIGSITIRRCGFCNRGYHCHDIAVMSCKHIFHPFCLQEFLRSRDKQVHYLWGNIFILIGAAHGASKRPMKGWQILLPN
jgi:hypothetical protein